MQLQQSHELILKQKEEELKRRENSVLRKQETMEEAALREKKKEPEVLELIQMQKKMHEDMQGKDTELKAKDGIIKE